MLLPCIFVNFQPIKKMWLMDIFGFWFLFKKKSFLLIPLARLSKSTFSCAIKLLWLQFCAETCDKNYIKTFRTKKKLVQIVTNTWNYWHISSFLLIVKKFAQILKNFVQSCDYMIAACINSALSIILLYNLASCMYI